MTLTHLIRPDLLQFKPYSSARDEAKAGKIWLNANELPWAQDNHLSVNRYPQKQPVTLLEKISSIYQVLPNQLALCRGSDEAIDLLIRLFCQAQKDAVMIFPPTFGMYAVYSQLQGAKVIEVPLKPELGFQLDKIAIFEKWQPKIKLIFVCSPNNPTANLINTTDIIDLCERFIDKSIVIVDEAYIEFSNHDSLVTYLEKYPNLVILRTFSKAYGSAGIRLGALLAHPTIIDWIKAIMAPYPLSSPTIAAIENNLSSQQLKKIDTYISCISQQRDLLIQAFSQFPWIQKIWPSDANFILIKVCEEKKIMQLCAEKGIILRSMHNRLGLDNCIRISIGTPQENQILLQVLSNNK